MDPQVGNVAPGPLDCLEPAKSQEEVKIVASPIPTMVARGKYDKNGFMLLSL